MKTSRFTRFSRRTQIIALTAVLIGTLSVIYMKVRLSKPEVQPGPAVTRRLTAEQYQNIIRDVFGSDIDLGGRFEPDLRVSGLVAVGASSVSITAAGMEQYDAMARAVAAQVVDDNHRESMIPCKPKDPSAADNECARTFLSSAGRLIYRRPLVEEQLNAYVLAAAQATEIKDSFYEGVALSLAAMLSSPDFLFREEIVEPDPDRPGMGRLDAFSKASQLSFFLWDSAPDPDLLDAAERGDLHTKRGLARQVDRMMSSPRLEEGVRAFFIDYLRFDEFENLVKDGTLFPKFSAQVSGDAQEQTLKTIMDVVLTRNVDFRQIFRTKRTFLTPELGAIYQVPIFSQVPNGAPDEWQPFVYADSDPRGGIVTQVAFTALHSPAGRGSPTLRGKALREIFLCQSVPAPPGDVDFSGFQENDAHAATTARERLGAHATNASCSGCHKIMDPIGLALENFDGSGAFRTTEGGQVIDTSGELDGVTYQDSAGLIEAVAQNPAVSSCLVDRLSARALGRVPTVSERAWTKDLKLGFERNGYRLTSLMRQIATSSSLYSVSVPKGQSSQDSVLAQVAPSQSSDDLTRVVQQ